MAAECARIARIRPPARRPGIAPDHHCKRLREVNMTMAATTGFLPLEALSALEFSGADATTYLQGQLSADLRRGTVLSVNYSGLHNPQGRVLARLALAPGAGGGWFALLPADLAPAIAVALKRFVLRSRVTIAVLPAGCLAVPAGTATPVQLPAGACWLDFPDGRRAALLPAGWPAAAAGGAGHEAACAEAWRAWQAREVALGLAEVYPATSGSFVAQMLNLDCIGAIAFDKGCYTGQEVIARAHYRGKVKRRLQRFAAPAPLGRVFGLAPGGTLRLADGRNAQLVREATLPDGSCEFLAVCTLPGAATAAEGGNEPALAPAPGDAPAVDSRPLPLPYPLPE
jgi:tRNA-modifying protein YgfZ